MPKAARIARAVLAATLVVAGGLAVSASPAPAVDTPVYNAPPGGGPIVEEVVKFGPFQLDPQGTGHWEDIGENLVPRPAGTFGMKYAFFDMVDENGNSFGHHDVHMHHFVIGTVNKTDPACPDRTVAGIPVQPLVGSGMEKTPIAFADPYAVKVESGDAWGAVWHLMNMTNTPKTVYVQYKIGMQHGATAENTRFLTPFFADARGCPSGNTWDVPGDGGPGSIETHTRSWAMPADGYLVGVGGHFHEGGISITTRHEDGTFICENLANYVGGMLETISPCPLHDSVRQGELLSVTSRYDNSAPHEAVMGMGVMFLWFGDQGTPPTSTTPTTAPPATVAPAVQVTPTFTG